MASGPHCCSMLTVPCSYGITDLRTKSQIYPQVIDVCGPGGKLSGTDVSAAEQPQHAVNWAASLPMIHTWQVLAMYAHLRHLG
jgi:hypothetical protein